MTDFDEVCRHGNGRDACREACGYCGHSCTEHDAVCDRQGCGCVAFVENGAVER